MDMFYFTPISKAELLMMTVNFLKRDYVSDISESTGNHPKYLKEVKAPSHSPPAEERSILVINRNKMSIFPDTLHTQH